MGHEIGLSIIAERYAKAVLDIAEDNKVLDFVKNDLVTVSKTIQDNKDLKDILQHPLVKIKDKHDIMEQVFADKISPYVINLIKILLDRNRMFIFDIISDSYKMLFNKRFNIAEAEVITAIKIDEATQNNIQQKLSELLSKHVELNSKVDPEIIAGMIVKLDDMIIDGSINGRLESIKRQLI